jgi:hypothetical protein
MRTGFGFGAMARRRRGAGGPPALTANKRALFIGDSTFAGQGAGGGTGIDGARVLAVPYKARDRLAALGINAICEAVVGDNNNGITQALWNAYRPDVTITGTLATSSQSPTVGGIGIRQAAGAAITKTSTIPIDTVEFWYPRSSAFGTLALSIDGGTATTYSEANATADYVKTTISGLALAAHSFAFSVASGTAHGPFLINCYNSAVPAVQIFNAGARNWTSTNWVVATGPASPLNAIATIAPHLVIINLGINDYRQAGTTIATFKANMQALINASVSAGATVILVVPTPIGSYSTVTDAWSQAAVRTAYGELAATNGCALIDTPALLFGAGYSGAVNPATFTELNAGGRMFDTLHPNNNGIYQVEGYAIGDAMKTALGL